MGKQLGRGAFGLVYRATQPSLGREVAVKFISLTAARNESDRKRFEREAPLLARIQHPAVPYVLTQGTVSTTDTPYLVLELIEGPTLGERIDKGGCLPLRDAIDTTTTILSALSAAHKRGVIHRDVKPDNVILGTPGPVLIDFSVGVCLEYTPGLTRATNNNQPLGDMRYASPEQLKDASTVDFRTDIYSAGVVLFEQLTGHLPVRLDQLSEDLANVPSAIHQIVACACARSRDKRFDSAAAFAKALEPFLGNDTTVTGVALCPNAQCELGHRSVSGYYRGPRVLSEPPGRFCESCGTELLRSCSGCGNALPQDIQNLIVVSGKGEDRTAAHCARCGTALFITPTCERCGSLLQFDESPESVPSEGCGKCRRRAETLVIHDDGIPF